MLVLVPLSMREALAEEKIIAISFPNSSTIGAVTTSLNQSRAKGAEMGYKVVVDDPGADMNKQINTLKTWIQQKVPVIVCVTPQPAVFESIAKQAREAGIKWITYGETLKNQDATVGYAQYDDGRRLGEYAGQWIAEKLGGKAKVAILGYQKASWGQLRGKGIKDGLLAKVPDVEIVAEQDAINPSDGLNVTRAILQANPDVNVILGIEDPATEGAYKAWVASGKDKADPNGFIGGMDGTIPALTLLKDGGTVYRASMAIPLKGVGDAIVTTADRLLKGENTGDTIVPLELVTEGSPKAADYLKEQGAL
ncbi:sugar ABC transporter substrate-binding protein [Mesorhizobium sp. CGMCC 1.15528]|uniref:Sugar ABC transporter substrate-binding protein n=1 Tax=Mesorhizobium zhangyense TaxID=1776730 RepID=A0A7C9RAY0_9HYPH|nr:sugar ABC transporter substrate-binding protein [Mesorhizobium zhangyense]NGN44534.1 sugar ABC transporter substrate-binding protein [Mesorhizobium zhangyense]